MVHGCSLPMPHEACVAEFHVHALDPGIEIGHRASVIVHGLAAIAPLARPGRLHAECY